MQDPNVLTSFKKAFELNLAASDKNIPNVLSDVHIKLYRLYIKISPSALMDTSSPKKVLDLLREEDLSTFFINLAARFQFLFSEEHAKLSALYASIYNSCNVHDKILNVIGTKATAINLLGEENAQAQLNFDQGLSVLTTNRWYAMFCLFILTYDGAHSVPVTPPEPK